jgi:hypothetical protein
VIYLDDALETIKSEARARDNPPPSSLLGQEREKDGRRSNPIDGDAQKLQESRKTLSENEEWLQKNSGKLVSK